MVQHSPNLAPIAKEYEFSAFYFFSSLKTRRCKYFQIATPLLPSGEKGREQGGVEEVLDKARQLERSVAELSVKSSQQRQDLVGAECRAVE